MNDLDNRELLMVTVSGRDRPGITAAFSRVLMKHGAELVDIEQASLQDLLGLSFILDLSSCQDSSDSVIKDLLFKANKLRLQLHFRIFNRSELVEFSQNQAYVLTFFGGVAALAELSAILGEEKVNIETISSRTRHGPRCVEMVLNAGNCPSTSRLKNRVLAKSRELNIDLALQNMSAYRKAKRLVFFDMDCTLLDMEVIDELARRAGVFREVSRITEKAMRGEFDFEESLIQRVALLKGLSLKDMAEVRETLRLSEGIEELIKALKMLGYKLGLVTGGFDFFAQYFKDKLGLDFAYANKLERKNGKLTGRLLGDIIDGPAKARIVNRVAGESSVLLDQTVVVGDGANDALMLGQAGLGIAYNAKAGLEKAASGSFGRTRMMNILHLLGITEQDLAEAERNGE